MTIFTLTELLSAANAAGEAERARYHAEDGEVRQDTGISYQDWSKVVFTGSHADCQRYIADRGYAARDAYLAEHGMKNDELRWHHFDECMRLLAGAGDGGNDVA